MDQEEKYVFVLSVESLSYFVDWKVGFVHKELLNSSALGVEREVIRPSLVVYDELLLDHRSETSDYSLDILVYSLETRDF